MLEPFKEVIIALQYRDQPTISWIYMFVTSLLGIINDANKEMNEIRTLCNILESELRTRFDNVLKDEIFIVSAFIDPATTGFLNDEECDKARNALVTMVRIYNTHFLMFVV